jgi:hypothetical protein
MFSGTKTSCVLKRDNYSNNTFKNVLLKTKPLKSADSFESMSTINLSHICARK